MVINIDEELLAKILKIDKIPEYVDLSAEDIRMAARVLTDAYRASDPQAAMINAVAWIRKAYDAGFSKDRADEKKYWENKIKKLFGIL